MNPGTPSEPITESRAFAYLLVGAASGLFVAYNLSSVGRRLGVSPSLLIDRGDNAIGRAIVTGVVGIVLAMLIGTRHRWTLGCAATYLLGPFLCCGACSGYATETVPYFTLLFAGLQLAFIYVGVRTADWFIDRIPRKPNP